MKNFDKKDFNFASHGGYFAFGQDQFNKIKDDHPEVTERVSCGMGLVAPKATAKQMLEAFEEHNEKEKIRRLEEVGLKNIILYELSNFECRYTGDIEDAVERLEYYGATREQIMKLFRNRNAEI